MSDQHQSPPNIGDILRNPLDTNPKTGAARNKPGIRGIPLNVVLRVGRVFTLGIRKYGLFNWRLTSVSSSVYLDAAFRHIAEYQNGEEKDLESGESPLAHAIACLMILLDAEERGKLIQDHRTPEVKK